MLSDFDRTLRGLSGPEMLECARSLLERLSGGAANAAVRPGAAELKPVGSENAGRAGPDGIYRGERNLRALDGTSPRDPGFAAARSGIPETGLSGGRLTRDSQRRAAETPDAPVETLRRSPPAALSTQTERAGDSSGSLPASSGAAFQGPEFLYDPAAGARGSEMSRVSDFFKRDSRRYDSGCSLNK